MTRGREISRGGPADGPTHIFEARYWDIVPDERIVCPYDMHLDRTRISVSPAGVRSRRVAPLRPLPGAHR
jgi:uncharacterized protein YndB with AHSA1/START domain